jgi:16S rRNA processing protein RimM
VKQSKLKLLAVGSVAKPFGIKGDVIVQPLMDARGRFRARRKVRIGRNEDTTEARIIERAVADARGIRLKLKGIDTRTAAEKIRGLMLFVEEADAIRLPRGTYFIHDIIGLSVSDDQGAALGTVSDVLRYPANDVYVVRSSDGEILVPAVKEFVRKIDLGTRTLVVHLLDGMRG